MEAPPPQAQLYTYTNADAIASTSNVVLGQLSLASYDVYVLFDSGATDSFISTKLAFSISSDKDRTSRILRTSLPSGEILLSEFFLRQTPIIINGVTLKVDLIAIEMKDFDVILGMDFLGRNNAIINCYHRKVTFKPSNGEKFSFKERSLLNHKMIISSMQEWVSCAILHRLSKVMVQCKGSEAVLVWDGTVRYGTVEEIIEIQPLHLTTCKALVSSSSRN